MPRFSLRYCVILTLVLVGCESPTADPFPSVGLDPAAPRSGWVYSTGVDVTSKPYGRAVTLGSGRPTGMLLYVQCLGGSFDVSVYHHDSEYGPAATTVRYAIDGAPATTAEWAVDFMTATLHYRGASPVAFAELLARSRTLAFTANLMDALDATWIERSVSFQLDGLASHLPKVRSMCGV